MYLILTKHGYLNARDGFSPEPWQAKLFTAASVVGVLRVLGDAVALAINLPDPRRRRQHGFACLEVLLFTVALTAIATIQWIGLALIAVAAAAMIFVHLKRPTAPPQVVPTTVKPPFQPRRPFAGAHLRHAPPRQLLNGVTVYREEQICVCCGKARNYFKGDFCLKCSAAQPVGGAA